MTDANMKTFPRYIAYTHGSCIPNPGNGGHAYLLYDPDYAAKEWSSGEVDTTNNVQALKAVIEVIKATPAGSYLTVMTNSNYVRDGCIEHMPIWLAKGWENAQKKPIKNKDLWVTLNGFLENHAVVTFELIDAHSGNQDSSRVVQLAKDAAKQASTDQLNRLKNGPDDEQDVCHVEW